MLSQELKGDSGKKETAQISQSKQEDTVYKPFMSSTVRDASFIPKNENEKLGPAYYFSKPKAEIFKDKILRE